MKNAESQIARPRNADATRKKILAAAKQEFAQKGFDGARVEEIAARAEVNKQLLYYYFGSKDDLFTTVLDESYSTLRKSEAELKLDDLTAIDAILSVVEFTWKFYIKHPEFIQLLNSENQMEARHIRSPKFTKDVNRKNVDLMQRLLDRGVREGNVRPGIDPIQLYISIAALGFFYMGNRHTLSSTYGIDLTTRKALASRLAVIKESIQRWIEL